MTDVSSTIIVGEWTLRPYCQSEPLLIVTSCSNRGSVMTYQQARDLAQALQVWIERTAKVEDKHE